MTEQWTGGAGQPPYGYPYPQQAYGPPGGPVPPGQGQWGTAPPKPVTALGKWTAGMLGGAAGLQAVGGVLLLLDAEPVTFIAQGLSTLVMLACAALTIVWLHQVRSNIEHLDPYRWAGSRRLSKGWAIGSWFVPVGFLWLPLQVVLDVWWGTAEPTRERRRTPKIITGWWACWLLSWFTGVQFINTVTNRNGVQFESFRVNVFPGATALSALFATAAAVLLMLLVRKVTALQAARLVG